MFVTQGDRELSAYRPLYCFFSQQSLPSPVGKLAVTFPSVPSAPMPGTEECSGNIWGLMGWQASFACWAEHLSLILGLDGCVTSVSEYTRHLWLFTLSPYASPGTGIGQMAIDRILSSASSLQITFGEKLSLCNNTILVTWFHTAGKFCNTLDKSHFRTHLGEEFNFTVGGCDSFPPALLPSPKKSSLIRWMQH